MLPQVIATGIVHSGTTAGKLNGVIPAVTPNGTLYECISISLATPDNVSPSCNDGMAQQCSTTSQNVINTVRITYFGF